MAVLMVNRKPLTVTGATAQNKVYDGNTTATIIGATLVGVVSGDAVTLSGGETFASPAVGTGILVTANLVLGGTDAGNYTLTQPTGLTADITVLTAIEDNAANVGVLVYPNPAQEKLYVQTDANELSVLIYNGTGSLVVQSTSSSIDISHLLSGIYFVKVYTDSVMKIFRVVKL